VPILLESREHDTRLLQGLANRYLATHRRRPIE
jgi:hypothetical protein